MSRDEYFIYLDNLAALGLAEEKVRESWCVKCECEFEKCES